MTANQEAPTYLAGASLAYALGQYVALRSGNTGHIATLSYDSETGMPYADVILDEPIIIPASTHHPEKYPEIFLWRQHVALFELRPADENAVIRRRLREALRSAQSFIAGFEDDESQEGIGPLLQQIRDALRLVEP